MGTRLNDATPRPKGSDPDERLTHPGHSEIAGMDSSKGSDPDELAGRWELNPRPSLAATPMSSGLMGPREEFDVADRSSEGLSPPNPPLTIRRTNVPPHPPWAVGSTPPGPA